MIKKLLLFSTIFILLISCDTKQSKDDITVISGQIVNKVNDYLLLSNSAKNHDTVFLDTQGFFKHTLKQKQGNLYRIKHGELQYIYLEPGDSIVFRINTLEFDESLAFSGTGAEKNNFLINQFLNNEEFNKELKNKFNLNPEEFESLINTEKNSRNNELKTFLRNYDVSEGFECVAQANIDYNYYSQKELFTSYKNTFENEDASLTYPSSFYDYRNNIDYDKKSLSYYYAYYSFLNRYFDNLAYEKYKDTVKYNKDSYTHNKIKLKLIDSIIKGEKLHNHILTTSVRKYLMNADNTEEENLIIDLYNKLDHNKFDQDFIKEYAENSSRINSGNKISNLTLVNLDNESVMLNDITNRLTVLYFWSSRNIKHVREIHIRVAELKSKFPEYNYIGINTDTHFKNWKKVVENSEYNDKFEYQFENARLASNELLINSNNKAIIIDKNGIILEGNSHIFNQNFEGKLLGFINK